MSRFTYRQAGVDIDAGERFVRGIAALAAATQGESVLDGLGGFAAHMALDCDGMKEPVLVSCTDGVGTKLAVAIAADRHGTIGIDLVAMSVNDLICTGARPLAFLDYLACGRLDQDVAQAVVAGIAAGCRQAGCALVGGETAEMPGFYPDGHYDLAGFAMGLVDRSRIIDGTSVRPGDQILGLASSGLHSNGYSLARKVLLEVDGADLEGSLADELLQPTRIYVQPVLEALGRGLPIRAMAHITGGGLPGNLTRGFPRGTCARLRAGSWVEPPVFALIARGGRVSREEMLRTFNLGIGFAWVVPPEALEGSLALCRELGVPACRIGDVVEGDGELLWEERSDG